MYGTSPGCATWAASGSAPGVRNGQQGAETRMAPRWVERAEGSGRPGGSQVRVAGVRCWARLRTVLGQELLDGARHERRVRDAGRVVAAFDGDEALAVAELGGDVA